MKNRSSDAIKDRKIKENNLFKHQNRNELGKVSTSIGGDCTLESGKEWKDWEEQEKIRMEFEEERKKNLP